MSSMVFRPRRRAAWSASRTLRALPEHEMPRTTSPGRPSAQTSWANSRSGDVSLATAELVQGWIQGAVVGEVDESGPHKPFEQLTGDVIGIGGTPTIAREEELATVGETGFQDLKRCLNVGLARQEARVAGKKLIEVW